MKLAWRARMSAVDGKRTSAKQKQPADIGRKPTERYRRREGSEGHNIREAHAPHAGGQNDEGLIRCGELRKGNQSETSRSRFHLEYCDGEAWKAHTAR